MMFDTRTTVKTVKASRYLKALCNHFNRKVTATYDEDQGIVQFGFATCTMTANTDELILHVQADDAESFNRVKYIVADHLERFSGDESLQIQWDKAI